MYPPPSITIIIIIINPVYHDIISKMSIFRKISSIVLETRKISTSLRINNKLIPKQNYSNARNYLTKSLSNNKNASVNDYRPGVVVHACSPSYMGGACRIVVLGYPRQKHETLSEKQVKAKRAEDMASVVEQLPSKH
jgi:hypothetical protein